VPDNVPIEGWFMDSPGARTILVLHGASSVRDNFLNMEVGRVLYQHGYDLLMFDFRAHGGSGGEIGSIGDLETRDIAGALAYLKSRGVQEVGAIGWSMGASALINAAPEHPEIAAIVADSTFASLMTIVGRERERFGAPAVLDSGIALMTRLMYGIDLSANQPRRAITGLGRRPVLLIHALSDPLIPSSQSEELARAGADNPNLQLWIVPTVGHVASFSTDEEVYMEKVIHFFDGALPGSGAGGQ
jgi:pimeloyl-ACP methyl ester carboxylesterase